MIEGIVQGHVDQAQKAKAALDQKNYVEALGHTLAASLPLLGPAAAHIGETAGGSQPTMDKYGNIVTPGQAPDIPRAVGQATGLGVSMAVPEAIKAVRGTPTAADATEGAPAGSGGIISSTLNPTQQAAVDYLRRTMCR